MSDDLTGLGPRGFERMCRALAAYVLGPGIEAFGAGPDGGREATFCGLQQYPSASEPWNGYGVLQAKYKERLLGTGADAVWLCRQIKAELDAWANPGKRRVREGRRLEYLIFATNVPLSGVPGSGKDRIGMLIAGYAKTLGLKGWRVWDAAQISTFLDAYPQVRRAFAALIRPSEVLADMRDRLGTPPDSPAHSSAQIARTSSSPGASGGPGGSSSRVQAIGRGGRTSHSTARRAGTRTLGQAAAGTWT